MCAAVSTCLLTVSIPQCSFGVKKLGAVVAGAAWGSRSAQPQYAAIDNFAQQDAFASTVDDVQLLLPADVAPPRGCTQQDAGACGGTVANLVLRMYVQDPRFDTAARAT